MAKMVTAMLSNWAREKSAADENSESQETYLLIFPIGLMSDNQYLLSFLSRNKQGIAVPVGGIADGYGPTNK